MVNSTQMAEVHHAAVSRHRATIIGCLKESDPSIRRRALEVVFALVNERNVEELVRELLNYLVGLITPCEADAGGGQRAAGADQQGDVAGTAVRALLAVAGGHAAGGAAGERPLRERGGDVGVDQHHWQRGGGALQLHGALSPRLSRRSTSCSSSCRRTSRRSR